MWGWRNTINLDLLEFLLIDYFLIVVDAAAWQGNSISCVARCSRDDKISVFFQHARCDTITFTIPLHCGIPFWVLVPEWKLWARRVAILVLKNWKSVIKRKNVLGSIVYQQLLDRTTVSWLRNAELTNMSYIGLFEPTLEKFSISHICWVHWHYRKRSTWKSDLIARTKKLIDLYF